jgi:hypothetical protein
LGSEPSNLRIVGIALALFSAVLVGVGIHHVVATGTCSSTGYSANYGPVPTCPSGTGWWFAFVFGGIVGAIAGALIAGTVSMVFATVFSAIGFGSLSILLDSHAGGGEKVFAGIFGGCFAIVGVIAAIAVIGSALGSLRGSGSTRSRPPRQAGSPVPMAVAATASSAFGTPDAVSAFGGDSRNADPILSAYNASKGAATTVSGPVSPPAPISAPRPSPLNLVPSVQAAVRRGASGDAVDELGKLAELHKKGALTDAEFANAKSKLLGQM